VEGRSDGPSRKHEVVTRPVRAAYWAYAAAATPASEARVQLPVSE